MSQNMTYPTHLHQNVELGPLPGKEDTLHESSHRQKTFRDKISQYIIHTPSALTWKSSKDPRLESDVSPSYLSGLPFSADSAEPRWRSTTWASSKMGDSSNNLELIWEFTSLRRLISWRKSEWRLKRSSVERTKPTDPFGQGGDAIRGDTFEFSLRTGVYDVFREIRHMVQLKRTHNFNWRRSEYYRFRASAQTPMRSQRRRRGYITYGSLGVLSLTIRCHSKHTP